jgi:hypothetical protein
MTRYIDGVKKQRGLEHEEESGLRLDVDSAAPSPYVNLRIGK